MTSTAAEPLARLRERYPAPRLPRILVHRGTAGEALDIDRYAEQLRTALGAKADAVAVAASDGANWAAPSATVVHGTFARRFDRLDLHGIDEVVACFNGDCGDEANYAGTGGRGLTARLGRNDGTLGDLLAQGAYAALDRALGVTPEELIDAIEAGGFTGRGGAHFPVAMKWRLTAAHSDQPRMLVVNAEEGEPGVFKDRHLLEGDPHRLIEGILLANHAVGFQHAYVYINGQARNARAAFERALDQTREAGILDGHAWDRDFGIQIHVRSGAGGYVCGEESVILNSIEGERPVPRFKPPFATDRGLFDRPTVINNAETLCAVTTVFDNPPPPTKLVSLSGQVPRPGLYEVPVDGATTWAGLLAMAGANPQDIQAVLLGGPSGTFVLPDRFEEPLEMRALGAGGTVVLGRHADLAHVTRELAAYNMRESCGECTPCREGTARLVQLLQDPANHRDEIGRLIEVMTEASLCQLGGMAGRPVQSALDQFPAAFED
jgi:NADH-quinone oxidoreductase subunit F